MKILNSLTSAAGVAVRSARSSATRLPLLFKLISVIKVL